MDSATQDLLLQKLEELIIDEEKIVTVISASEHLNISVQDANKLLQTFAEDQKETTSKIAATYILSGVLQDGNLGVRLVKEDELHDKRERFKTVSSEVLYSLQKSNSIDIYSVIAVNGFDACGAKGSPIAGSLTNRNCSLRSAKPKPLPKPETKPVIKGKSSFFTKCVSAGDAESKQETTEPKKEEVKEKKGSSFTKSASTGSTDNKKSKEANKNNSKQASKPKANGGISSFFNKIPAKAVLTEKSLSGSQNFSSESQTSLESNGNNKLVSEDEEKTSISGIEECLTEEAMDVDIDKTVPSQKSEKTETVNTPTNKPTKSKRQRSATKKNDKPSKRRKRIKEMVKSDSDSDDDMFADNTEEKIEDIINNSDDEQPAVKHKIETPPPVKNKRRKLVDKTFEDEEGFIITSKEWVYESASEDEKEQKDPVVNTASQETNTVPPAKPKREISPPVTGKNKGKKGKKNGAANQPTLMSFFKKA